jgi:GNAT superfamily N-acetyltransferase
VFKLLGFLPALYPGSFEWLDRRLEQILEGKGRCTVVNLSGRIAGITIESPKTARTVKLSTIFVDAHFRGRRVGTALLADCCNRWRQELVKSCHVTADYRIARDLSPLLKQFSFKETAMLMNRYGPGRHEVVFLRNSDRDC